jgi:hypothetical protein
LTKVFVKNPQISTQLTITMLGLKMTRICLAASPEDAAQPAQAQPKRRFTKNLYVIIAAILTIVAITGALFLPTSQATIPLNVDYTVGEKMIYGTTMSATMQMQNSTLSSEFLGQLTGQDLNNTATMNGQDSLEVVAFDGQYYTLNHTVTMTLGSLPLSYSMLEKINKTGYSTYMLNLGNTEVSTDTVYSSYIVQLLSQPDVTVGSSVTIPFPSTNSSLGITGNLTITFGNIEDLTVPAGTYKAFLINMTSSNLQMNMGTTGLVTDMAMDLNYQIYMEYGTMRQIKSSMQEKLSYETAGINVAMNLTMSMTLDQHIKP